VADRQSRIYGFSQAKLSAASIVSAGAGGLMAGLGEGLARKGVKLLTLCDFDPVEPSNLNRQFFYERDLWKNKAICGARNFSKEGFLGTEVTGIAMDFMSAIRSGLVPPFDCIVSAVDDERAREEIAEYGLIVKKPVVTLAVSSDGDAGYVHIQRPGEGCWGCAFPRKRRLRDDPGSYRAPCPGTPAIKDILMLLAGAGLYAIDTLLMDRPISWNYREFHLAGFAPDVVCRIERVPGCHLCGGMP